MMTALKLYGHTLLAGARAPTTVRPLLSRPGCRSLVVSAAKASSPAITQGEFVDKLAERLDGDKTGAKTALKAVLDLIADEVAGGNKVTFQGWGLLAASPLTWH
jgi:hypothetical protein